MQLILLKESLNNTQQFEIFNSNTRTIIIQNIDLEFHKNFHSIKLVCNNIQLKNHGSQSHIIDKIDIAINLDVIYQKILDKNNTLPIFNLYIYGFDIGASTALGQEHSDDNKNYTNILAKILQAIDQQYISHFQLEINFKHYNISSAIGNIQIQKISFENIIFDKSYIGELKLTYNFNGENSFLYGFLHKERENSENRKFILEFHGYINTSIKIDNYVINPQEFYKVLLTYDITKNNFELAVDLRGLNFHSNNIPSIFTENIKMISSYNLTDKILYIKQLDLDLISQGKQIPIKSNGLIYSNGDLEIKAISHSIIDKEVIYSLWPDIAKKQKMFLQSFITDTKISNPVILITAHKQLNNLYKIDNLQLDFNLENTILEKKIKGYKYKFDIEKAFIKINLNNIKIRTDNLYLNHNIPINNLIVLIPLDISKKALFDFEFNTTTNSVYKELNRYLDNVELLSGMMKGIMHLELPMKAIDLKDLLLSGQITTNKLKVLFNHKEREFSTEKFLFELKKHYLSCFGDIKYNNIEFKKFKLLFDIKQDNIALANIKLKSADFIINLAQEKIQTAIDTLQSQANGLLGVQVLDDKTIKLNLDNIAILKTPINFKKDIGVKGELDMTITSEETFQNINLKLPDIEATGDCNIKDNKFINLNFKFKKLYSSSFNITYSKLDNIYRIDGSIIDLNDLKMIIDNIKKEKDQSFLKGNNIALDEEVNLMISSDHLLLNKKVILENLFLKLNLKSGNIVKIDGYAYGKDRNGYIRIFFDSPIFALIINNIGYLTDEALQIKTINRGSLGLYLSMQDFNLNGKVEGDLYLNNFKLLKSPLLSTILKIYALSGFSVKNIFQMFNNGINFSNMHCAISSNNQSMLFENCQAFSDAMLLSAEAKLDLYSYNGELQGLIIPKNLLNAPIIFLQQILSKKGKTLLDDMEDRQNFSIIWSPNKEPIIQTNPISFILPSIFNNFFSKKKTVKNQLNSFIR